MRFGPPIRSPQRSRASTQEQKPSLVPRLNLNDKKDGLSVKKASTARGRLQSTEEEGPKEGGQGRLSPQRRKKLQRLLRREELRQALTTLLQVSTGSADLSAEAVRDEVNTLLDKQHPPQEEAAPPRLVANPPRPTTAETSLRSNKGVKGGLTEPDKFQDADPKRPQTARGARTPRELPPRHSPPQAHGENTPRNHSPPQEESGPSYPPPQGTTPRNCSERNAEAPPPENFPPVSATKGVLQKGEVFLSYGRPRGESKPRVMMPYYSVAGKRVPLLDVVRDKITQRAKGGAHQLLKAFKHLDRNADGKVSTEEMQEFLQWCNLKVDHSVVSTFVNAVDSEGSGSIDYRSFVQRLLPEDLPLGSLGLKFGGENGGSWEHSLFLQESALQKQQHQVINAALEEWRERTDAAAMESIIRQKIQGRLHGGPYELRKAFNYLDRDGSGYISELEFKQMLHDFNLSPTPQVFKDMMRTYDPDGNRRIDFQEFVTCFMPTYFTTSDQSAAHKEKKVRENLRRKLDPLEAAVQSVVQQRKEAVGDQANPQQGVSERLTLVEVLEACTQRSLPLDKAISAKVAEACHRNQDHRISSQHFGKILQKFEEDQVTERLLYNPPDFLASLHEGKHPNFLPQKTGVPYAGRPQSADELSRLLKEKIRERFGASGPRAQMRAAYAYFDRKGSGKVRAEEFCKLAGDLNVGHGMTEMQELLKRLDPSSSGYITFDDFYTCLNEPPGPGFGPATGPEPPTPWRPLDKHGRPFTATPRQANFTMEQWRVPWGPAQGRLITTPRGNKRPSSAAVVRPQTAWSGTELLTRSANRPESQGAVRPESQRPESQGANRPLQAAGGGVLLEV